MKHLADSSSTAARPVCKDVSKDMTLDIFAVDCPECRPCEHVLAFVRETREKAREHFVSIEQVHCHSCSGIWELPS